MDNPPILFIHIAKTAGTSLKTLLATRIAPSATLEIPEQTTLRSKLVRHVDDYELVVGHVDHRMTQAFRRPPAVITFLREPIDRALSAYYFLRQSEGANIPTTYTRAQRRARVTAAQQVRELSIREFLHRHPQTATSHMGSIQTAILGQQLDRRRRSRPLGADDLERAKQRLEQCVAFGLTERVDESMTLICHSLGWAPFDGFPHANPTLDRGAVADLDVDTLDELRELTALDGELYRFATELFEQRWQALSASRPAAAVSVPDAQGASTFRFDRRIPGTGWHGSERMNDAWCSWTGPGNDATIELPPPPGDRVLLRVSVGHLLHPDAVHRTQLLINDVLLETSVRHDGELQHLEADVPADALRRRGDLARITIRTPIVLRPCDVDPNNADSRLLGLAVASVSLVAAAPPADT
ncbi:MAG: sulfotransferase family 2 domain-containing protein [Ilumatobacteraceae bacterium]